MMERQRPHSKVSLEDLLRLKRAERPAPEFWAEFENQLRHKQLAAIVDKRPWWRRISATNLAKISIPAGATAVIAFTLVAVREHFQLAPDSAAIAAAPITAPSVSAPATRVAESLASDGVGSVALASDHASTASSSENSAGSLSTGAAANASSHENGSTVVALQDAPETSLAQVILGLEGATESDARPQYQSDSAPLLVSLNMLDDNRREQSVSSMEPSPISQISAPHDDRRARLLASIDSQDRGDMIATNSRVARSRERIANRLAEQSLYDSISRLGLNGDSVSIKF